MTDLIITGHLYSLLNPLLVQPGIDRDESTHAGGSLAADFGILKLPICVQKTVDRGAEVAEYMTIWESTINGGASLAVSVAIFNELSETHSHSATLVNTRGLKGPHL